MTYTFRAESRDITVPGLKKPVANHHVDVTIFDTPAEFATAYDNYVDCEPDGTGATISACFHRCNDEDMIDGYLGEMWFCRETVGRDDIIHEAVHVAVCYAQLHFGGNRKFRTLRLPWDDDDKWREEVIAYVAAPLADHLIEVLLESTEELAHAA